MDKEFEKWWETQKGYGHILVEEIFAAGQAAERKRCAEIAKKDIDDQCTCIVCRERRKIAKTIEGE